MLPGYHYHIFVSYRNSDPVSSWLHNHFLPVLTNHLEGLLPEEPRIFVDREEIEAGSQWPEKLVNALQRSCCLLAIWNPPYFRSRWCMAEWHSMVAREKLLQKAGRSDIPCLIYPIVFADGEHFPEAAKKTQIRKDLKAYTYPYPQFSATSLYLEFHDLVGKIAEEISQRLLQVPEWCEDWPRVMPDPEPPPPTTFPSM